MQEEWFDPQPGQNVVRLPKVSFFGHTWSDRGLSADLKKFEPVLFLKSTMVPIK